MTVVHDIPHSKRQLQVQTYCRRIGGKKEGKPLKVLFYNDKDHPYIGTCLESNTVSFNEAYIFDQKYMWKKHVFHEVGHVRGRNANQKRAKHTCRKLLTPARIELNAQKWGVRRATELGWTHMARSLKAALRSWTVGSIAKQLGNDFLKNHPAYQIYVDANKLAIREGYIKVRS